MSDTRYLPAAAKRLQAVNAHEQALVATVAEIFRLEQALGKFDANIGSSLRGYEIILDSAVEKDDLYHQLQERVRSGISQSNLQEIQDHVANFQPSGLGKVFVAFKGDRSKEIDRRRFEMRLLIEAYLQGNPVTVAQLPDISTVPPFPVFPGTKNPFGR